MKKLMLVVLAMGLVICFGGATSNNDKIFFNFVNSKIKKVEISYIELGWKKTLAGTDKQNVIDIINKIRVVDNFTNHYPPVSDPFAYITITSASNKVITIKPAFNYLTNDDYIFDYDKKSYYFNLAGLSKIINKVGIEGIHLIDKYNPVFRKIGEREICSAFIDGLGSDAIYFSHNELIELTKLLNDPNKKYRLNHSGPPKSRCAVLSVFFNGGEKVVLYPRSNSFGILTTKGFADVSWQTNYLIERVIENHK